MTNYKSGDRVVYIGKRNGKRGEPAFFPPIGTVGTVIRMTGSSALVKWPDGSTFGDDRWYCSVDWINLFDEADFTELDTFLNEMSDKEEVRK